MRNICVKLCTYARSEKMLSVYVRYRPEAAFTCAYLLVEYRLLRVWQ